MRAKGYILDPNLNVVARDVLEAGSANRPHTTLMGDLVLTTWDQGGIHPAVYYRIDRLLAPNPADSAGTNGG